MLSHFLALICWFQIWKSLQNTMNIMLQYISFIFYCNGRCMGCHFEIKLKIRALWNQVRLEKDSASHILVRLHWNSAADARLLPLKPRCRFFSPPAMNHNFTWHCTLPRQSPQMSQQRCFYGNWHFWNFQVYQLKLNWMVLKPFWTRFGVDQVWPFWGLSLFGRFSHITGVKMCFGEHLCH